MTLKQSLEMQRNGVYNFINQLFDATPNEPNLYIGKDPFIQKDSALLSTHSQANMISYYSEEDQRLVIDPRAVERTVRYEKGQGLRIDPLQEIVRTLAKEYGQHVHSHIHNFGILDQANAHIEEAFANALDPESPLHHMQIYTVATMPLARTEGIGYLALLRVAEELGHDDDYSRKIELDGEYKRQNARKILLNMEHGTSEIIQVANAFAYWLAKNWIKNKELPMGVVRAPITFLDEETLVQAMKYLIPE